MCRPASLHVKKRGSFFYRENVFFLHPGISPNSSHPFHLSDGSQSSLSSLSSLDLSLGTSLSSWFIDSQSPQVFTMYLHFCAGHIVLGTGHPWG